jgi:hypothetical protein
MNENVLAVPNSVITDPVEAINYIDIDSTNDHGVGDDVNEVCDTDSGLVGQLAVNDPE